jgi:hypothetical protein
LVTICHTNAGRCRYPTVCNIAFSALNCRSLSESVTTLVADDTIVCIDSSGITGGATIQTSNFHLYRILSCVVIGIFGVGVPFGFLLYIYCTTREVDESVWGDADGHDTGVGQLGARRTGSNSSSNGQQTDSICKRMAVDVGITEERARGSFREISTLSNMSNLTEAYNPKYPCEQSIPPPSND